MGQPGKAPGNGLRWETISVGSSGWSSKARSTASDPIEDLLGLFWGGCHPLPEFLLLIHFTHLLVGCWLWRFSAGPSAVRRRRATPPARCAG